MTTISTQQSIIDSIKRENWYMFYENNAGGYKAQALETVIRNLASEKGADEYAKADKFLAGSNSYKKLREYYETELEGTVIDLPFNC